MIAADDVHVVERSLDLDLASATTPAPPSQAKSAFAPGTSPARAKRLAKSEQLARRAGRRKILEFRKQRRQHFSTHGSDPEYFPRREMWRWNDRSETASSFSTLNHSPEAVSPPPASELPVDVLRKKT